MQSLKDKVVVITGGASGYGRAMAELFVQEECRVVVTDINEKMLAEVKDELGVDAIKMDVTSLKDWEAVHKAVFDKYTRTDILINNAGGAVVVRETIDQEPEIIDKILTLNLNSVIYGCKVFGKLMKEQNEGTIINISSSCAKQAWPNFSVYAAAKSGVLAFSKGLYVELRPFNVRVTTIIPGAGDTNFSKNASLPEPDEPYSLKARDLAEGAVHICKQPQRIFIEEYILWGTDQEVIPL